MKKLVSITFDPNHQTLIGLDTDGVIWIEVINDKFESVWKKYDAQFDPKDSEEAE